VNRLRLYSAKAASGFDLQVFHRGDYLKAMERQIASEMISKVLYPSDSIEAGRELRLVQEYFLVSCALDDIIKTYLKSHDSFDDFPDKVAIQLNDTHPSLAVAELMRRLLDEHELPWDTAWEITQATLAYTNHTLLPEALEKWSVSLFEYVLPRHLQIIYDINECFLRQVATVWPHDLERLRRMSIIEEGNAKRVCMAHLAIVGSHSVNGVSELHSGLLQTSLVPDFYQLWPERFNNKTNGITPRRWLLHANPQLATLITTTIGDGWITNLDEIRALEPYADDARFQQAFMAIKRANKYRLAQVIMDTTGVSVLPDSLFDIHIKRIHEYKRQTLNVLHIIYLYLRAVVDQQPLPSHGRVFLGQGCPRILGSKTDDQAIHNVAEVINNDPRVADQLSGVHSRLPRIAGRKDHSCGRSERTDLHRGHGSPGTGNMKFALNGALTIGTLDGANIEIREEVGPENIYIFGLRADEIQAMRRQGTYAPREYTQRNPAVQRVTDAM
jgi:starch phosphorylase